ncbi:chemotaxis protein CheW [Dasania marina]|uniref:chemotaxis protein CheW n=1 Tax=Dasania marina TaxID=471499 RepID=UPI0030D82049|tara:strand:+ start:21996 stop:23036 length:1041 start_codon:yes stop_codon:yes gene_type:complete
MSKFEQSSPPSPPNNEIQDYLDLLLAPTADPSNAVPTELGAAPSSESIPPPAVAPSQTSPASYQSAPVGRSRLSQAAARIEQESRIEQDSHSKPYAEPVKPLALQLPLPKVAPPPVVAPVVEARPAEPQTVAVKSTPAPTPTLKTTAPVVPAPAVVAPEPIAEVVVEPTVATTTEPQQQAHPSSVWLENGRPSWAQQRFECLLFSVGGLTLAVPLAELGSIIPITDELTPLFGQIDWFMGLLTVKQGNIRTVNTAKVVMPERYQEGMADNFNYVISINGVDWGLAVDDVASAITLSPEDVRWRSERSKRPWLAGTVVDHMCALLDVSQLASMFIERDRNRSTNKAK